MNLKQYITAGMLAVPFFLTVGNAGATSITGQANIAGSVSVDMSNIYFDQTFTNAYSTAQTGDFAGLKGGKIQSLTNGPVTGAVDIPSFATFTKGVAEKITFDLTYIAPGIGSASACSSAALGAMCTPAGSPFTLFQLTSNTVLASLQLDGDAYIGSKATGYSTATSLFSTQFVVPGTIPGVLNQLANGGIQGQSYSASFTATPIAPVPEPASMLLMGLGLIGAGVIARRKATR